MARTKKVETASGDKVEDHGQTEVQKTADESQDQGYVGRVPDPNDNEAYTVQTGPESPTAVPDSTTRYAAHVENTRK